MNRFLVNEPELQQLSSALLSSDLSLAKSILKKPVDINTVLKIPKQIDLEQYRPETLDVSLKDRLVDGSFGFIWKLFVKTSKVQPVEQTTTLLNTFVTLNELKGLEAALSLGANPLQAALWIGDAFETAIQLRKPDVLDLLFKFRSFSSLPEKRQHQIIKSLARGSTRGNAQSGYTCELDPSLLEVGLRHKIDFDQNLETENWDKSISKTTLIEESINESRNLPLADWLLKNGFGTRKDRSKLKELLKKSWPNQHSCKNAEAFAEKILVQLES